MFYVQLLMRFFKEFDFNSFNELKKVTTDTASHYDVIAPLNSKGHCTVRNNGPTLNSKDVGFAQVFKENGYLTILSTPLSPFTSASADQNVLDNSVHLPSPSPSADQNVLEGADGIRLVGGVLPP